MLVAAVESYLALRRATGRRLECAEVTLRGFAQYATDRGEQFVRSQTALEWVKTKSVTAAKRAFRLADIVRFARFMHAEDVRHEVPPRDFFGRHSSRRRPPFLFTDEEVGAIVTQAQKLGPDGAFQPLVYSTLFGLLACTGLRLAESLDLRIGDFTPAGLIIRKGKFGKSRLVPLHPSTKEQLERYLDRRTRTAGSCDYLFPSRRGRRLKNGTLFVIFWKLLRAAGIPSLRQGRRPRIHDLRFHFANRALAQCPGTHEGISRHMLSLATYLGHKSMMETYWYLEATPALLSNIAERCQQLSKGDGL